MRNLSARVNRLKNQIDKIKQVQSEKLEEKIFPFKNWVEMAEATMIRSGGKMLPFVPYDYQIKSINEIIKYPVTVIAKGRQLGMSQIVCTWLLFRACTEPGFVGVVLSKTQTDTSQLAHRIKAMAKFLSEYMEFENEGLMWLSVKGGGELHFRNGKTDGTRGIDSVSALVFDEAAFISDFTALYSAATPTVQMSGDDARIIILSTPNGLDGCHFADRLLANNPSNIDPIEICESIRNGELPPYYSYVDKVDTCKQFIHWKAHPIYSKRENYLENIAKRNNEPLTKVKQEYDLSFNSTEDSIFKAEVVKNATTEDPIDTDPGLYYIGVDMSGVGKDYTVFTVFKEITLPNQKSYLQLADLYRKRTGTTDAHMFVLSDMIERYDASFVGIEVNGVGQVVYERLSVIHRHGVTFHPIKTTNQSKLPMIERLKYCLESSELKYNREKFSKLTQELLGFKRQENGTLGAAKNYHDDIVMSTAFAVECYYKFSKGMGK